MIKLVDITIDPPGLETLVDPMSWFDTPGPFEIEIGCGKGGFLLSRARARSDIRLLGIEWANRFYTFCADRMVRWNIGNVRVMRTDAKHFIMRNLPAHCLSTLHLYHPDPWPKKRHHKRRLVQPDFAAALVKALIPGGQWFVQSDHEEYFQQIRDVLALQPKLTEFLWDSDRSLAGPDWQGTNYEVKYARAGRAVFRAAWEKIT